MICPYCKEKVPLNQYWGIYKGQIFIIKGFYCCKRRQIVENANEITIFSYDQKLDGYLAKKVSTLAPLQKLDPYRIMGSTEMGRFAT